MIKRLCIFAFSYSPNRQAMLDYLEKSLPKDVEMFIFTTKNYKKNYKTDRIKIVDTNCSRLSSPVELRRFCRKNNIDIIISLGLLPYEAFPMIFASLFTKTDFICYNLGNPIEVLKFEKGKRKIVAYLETLVSFLISGFPKKIIFCSKDITNKCQRYLFFVKNKIFFLPTTIPTDFYLPKDKRKIRKKLGFNEIDKILLFVGRIGYLKGLDFFMSAVKNNPNKKFVLVGNLVDNTFKDENLKNLILIPVKSPKELVDYYNAADLCFFPSRLEGVALVPREAMACGTPAMVLDTLSSKSIEKAIKVPLDYNKINNAITDFFNLSKEEREKLSKESREYIQQEYGDNVWKDLYADIILN